jgi:tetratricopeptide (TPR) repeat protein
MHYNYGIYLCEQGRYDEGTWHLKEAVRIWPALLIAKQDIYLALLKQKKLDEAIDCYTEALQERNDWPDIHKMCYELGWAYEQKGNLALAEINYRKALTIKPDYVSALDGLRGVFTKQGKLDEAIAQLNAALQISTNQSDVYAELGAAYDQLGKYDLAIRSWTKVVELDPNNIGALNNTAWLLATAGDISIQDANRAIEFAERACELTEHKNPESLDTLAAAYAAVGSFPEAIETAEKAIELAKTADKKDMAEEIQKRLELYKAGQPYHEK